MSAAPAEAPDTTVRRPQHRPALRVVPALPQALVARDRAARAEDWRDSALCAQVDGDLFFPDKGGSNRAAKKICAACDVQAECLAYALENSEPFGVWAGTSERQRTRMQRSAQ